MSTKAIRTKATGSARAASTGSLPRAWARGWGRAAGLSVKATGCHVGLRLKCWPRDQARIHVDPGLFASHAQSWPAMQTWQVSETCQVWAVLQCRLRRAARCRGCKTPAHTHGWAPLPFPRRGGIGLSSPAMTRVSAIRLLPAVLSALLLLAACMPASVPIGIPTATRVSAPAPAATLAPTAALAATPTPRTSVKYSYRRRSLAPLGRRRRLRGRRRAMIRPSGGLRRNT